MDKEPVIIEPNKKRWVITLTYDLSRYSGLTEKDVRKLFFDWACRTKIQFTRGEFFSIERRQNFVKLCGEGEHEEIVPDEHGDGYHCKSWNYGSSCVAFTDLPLEML